MKLMRDQRVKSWIQSYASYNVRSAKGYALEAFLRNQDTTTDELFSQPDEDIIEAVTNVVHFYVDEGRSAFARNIVDSVKSLLLFHDRDVKFKTFKHLRKGKRISFQVIPKASDVNKMADVAGSFSLRNKALILCLFQSGVRPSCITRWTYGMVRSYLYPELRVPLCLRITSEMDTKLPSYGLSYYHTFLGREACEALSDYLNERKREGWAPKESELIFVTAGQTPETRGEQMAVSHLDEMIKRVAQRSGITPKGIWPHCLRKAFRKVINNAPIDEDTKEALMGHSLPGSRTNYFDYHDLKEIARKYEQANFSRDSGNQLDALAKRLEDIDTRLTKEIEQLKSQLALLQLNSKRTP